MTIITQNHPKWPVYSRLPKCGEITASEDGVLFGLNCSRCPTIFSCANVKDFLRHQHEQHSYEQHSNLLTLEEQPSQKARRTKNRKAACSSPVLPGDDGDWTNATQKRNLRSTVAAAASFVDTLLDAADSCAALKLEVDFDMMNCVKSELCVLNEEAIDDPLQVADAFDRKMVLESECVKEEVCIGNEMAEEPPPPADTESHSCSDSEDDSLLTANATETSNSKNIFEELLVLAEIYESHSLLWDLDNDDNHNRTRVQETQRAMLQQINEQMQLNMTLLQLRGRIRLLRKYHAADKRRRLRAERYKIKFVPLKPLLYPKLQFLEPFVGPYHCAKCSEKISQYVPFKAHMAAHDGHQKYACSICQRDFKNLSLMLMHKRRHNGEKPHVCTTCGASFIYAKELSAHQTKHTGEKQCMCHICGAAYRTMQLLNKHKNRRHNPNRPRYQCTLCPKSFKEKNVLNGHMNTHLEVRNAVCPVCGKGFYVRKTMMQHLLIHDKEKRYQCDLCDKKFAQMAGLCTHRKMQHNIIKVSEKKLT